MLKRIDNMLTYSAENMFKYMLKTIINVDKTVSGLTFWSVESLDEVRSRAVPVVRNTIRQISSPSTDSFDSSSGGTNIEGEGLFYTVSIMIRSFIFNRYSQTIDI